MTAPHADLLRDPHVGEVTGRGIWVVRATHPWSGVLEPEVDGYLAVRTFGPPVALERVSAARFDTLADALAAGYAAREARVITADWTVEELPQRARGWRDHDTGSGGRA